MQFTFMILAHKAMAEMAGTFAVIFIGGGSILLAEKSLLPPLCVPLAWGFMVGLMIMAVGNISGAHFNPAVTFAFALMKPFSLVQVFVYWGSQLIGGALAVLLLTVLASK